MSSNERFESNCTCQYTLTVTNEVIEKEMPQTIVNEINDTPNIHEIDEEADSKNASPTPVCSNADYIDENSMPQDKNISDDESAYTGDSFCSDDSCDETITNVNTTHSFISDASSYLHNKSFKLGRKSKRERIEHEEIESACIDEEGGESTCCWSREDIRRVTPDEKFSIVKHVQVRRKNMSFTDDEMRKIERENELLLRKIMAHQKPRNKLLCDGISHSTPKISSSAINRKKLQRKIEGDNMLLLRRIQEARPCVMSNTTTPGYRLTLF